MSQYAEQEKVDELMGEVRDEAIQLVCFKLADEEYAVDITSVKEVIRVQKITPIPQMPDFTLGVLNIRGDIMPVFDLRKKFGLEEKEFDTTSKIMVVEVGSQNISLVVDAIKDNITIEQSSIDASPAVKMKISRECIKGIGDLENRMIIILDLEKVNELISQEIEELRKELGDNVEL